MNQETKDKIMKYHNKHLSIYFIASVLKMNSWDVQTVIESEIKQDYDSLFKGG